MTAKERHRICELFSREFLIREYITNKKSLTEIALEFHVSRDYVLNKLKQHKLPTQKEIRESILTNEFLEYEYVVLHKSSNKIAKEVGVSGRCILENLKKHNIPVRTSRESKLPKEAIIGDSSRWCNHCKRNLPLNMFNKSKHHKFGRAYVCRECRNKMEREYNREFGDKDVIRKNTNKSKLIMEFGNKCSICGAENLPTVAFAFHHVKPKDKTISFCHSNYSEESVLKEIREKCVLICFNCHQILHHGDKTATDYLEMESK